MASMRCPRGWLSSMASCMHACMRACMLPPCPPSAQHLLHESTDLPQPPEVALCAHRRLRLKVTSPAMPSSGLPDTSSDSLRFASSAASASACTWACTGNGQLEPGAPTRGARNPMYVCKPPVYLRACACATAPPAKAMTTTCLCVSTAMNDHPGPGPTFFLPSFCTLLLDACTPPHMHVC